MQETPAPRQRLPFRPSGGGGVINPHAALCVLLPGGHAAALHVHLASHDGGGMTGERRGQRGKGPALQLPIFKGQQIAICQGSAGIAAADEHHSLRQGSGGSVAQGLGKRRGILPTGGPGLHHKHTVCPAFRAALPQRTLREVRAAANHQGPTAHTGIGARKSLRIRQVCQTPPFQSHFVARHQSILYHRSPAVSRKYPQQRHKKPPVCAETGGRRGGNQSSYTLLTSIRPCESLFAPILKETKRRGLRTLDVTLRV